MADFYKNIVNRVKTSVDQWLARLSGDFGEDKIPREGDESAVSIYIVSLWKDALNARSAEFSDSGDERFSRTKPEDFWSDEMKLEAGNHWSVWGTRKEDTKTNWRHELVDDEIGNQVRAKVAYLTANLHDVSIVPNLKNIGHILDQERAKTGWYWTILRAAKSMKILGTAYIHSYLDVIDGQPYATEEVLDPASVFRTPFATSFEENEGCWYTIIAKMMNLQQVKSRYPKLDTAKLEATDADRLRKVTSKESKPSEHYVHTKLLDVYECWLDDAQQEVIPFDEEMAMQEHGALIEGAEITPSPNDNHPRHIDAHLAWMDANSREPIETDEDLKRIQQISELMAIHIEEHMELADQAKEMGLGSGKRFKYPFGRKIVVIGGQVAEDQPNPYWFPWRKLFQRIPNEEVLNRWDGRSDVEILWNTNKTMDIMLSRIADIALLIGTPKRYFDESSRDVVEESFSNNPDEPGFFRGAPPVTVGGQAPPELFNLYTAMKSAIQRQLGVSDIVFGKSPTSQASGELVGRLQQQVLILVTGEANKNLTAAVESMIETRLLMWRKFYTEARWYEIDGEIIPVNVSDLLTKREVENPETGEIEVQEIPTFEVRAKQNSNLPNQWEIDLQLSLMLHQAQIIPREAVLALLSQQYPQWGVGGKFYQLSIATEKGLQLMEQEQQAQEEKEKSLKKIATRFKSRAMADALKEGEPQNGEGRSRVGDTGRAE